MGWIWGTAPSRAGFQLGLSLKDRWKKSIVGTGANLGKAEGRIRDCPAVGSDRRAQGLWVTEGTGKAVWGLLKHSEDKDAAFVL